MNPWKVTAVAIALVIVTAVLTGMIVANWAGRGDLERKAQLPTAEPLKAAALRMAQSSAQAPPSRSTIETCNRQAAQQVASEDKTAEVVKDAAIGAVVSAAVGAGRGAAGTLFGLNESSKHDERYRDAYARCMRSRGYTS